MPKRLHMLPHLPDFNQVVELAGIRYGFEFRWRGRVEFWYFSMWVDDTGKPVTTGRAIQAGTAPLSGHGIENAPPGEILVTGPSNYDREDLGETLHVTYFSSVELERGEGPDDLAIT